MKSNVVILAIHQSHVGSRAGGYIRLKEFLRYSPSDVNSIVIDWKPSIYTNEVDANQLVTIKLPAVITFFLKHIQILGILLERIYTAFQAYYTTKKVLQTQNIKVLYVPIGEFLHLYLPAILLKKKFPDIKLVVDILNFQVYKHGFLHTLKTFMENSSNKFISFGTAVVSYVSFVVVKKTIHKVDYIFSVSPELAETINEVYQKKTIDFTPSGVNSSAIAVSAVKKKYLGVYVGRVTEQKGIFNCIDVWQKVVTKHPKALFAIAGIISPEIKQQVVELLKEKGLTKNIIIIGEITEKEKSTIINESEIFLHLANYEPLFPVIGILEGLAGGLPAVIFDMKVTRPVIKKIKNNNFLYVVENGDIEKAAEAVIQIATLSSNERKTIQKNARRYAEQFDWREIAKIEFNVIRKFIYEK